MHVLPQVFGPVDFHDDASLGRLDRIMRVGRDGCSACRKRPRHDGGALWNALRAFGRTHLPIDQPDKPCFRSTLKSHYPNPRVWLILFAVYKYSSRKDNYVKACEVVNGRRSGIPQQPRSGALVHG
jgi:hypothetical protein